MQQIERTSLMQPVNNEVYSEQLITYLQNNGWSLIGSEIDIAVLRKIISGQEEEIILPKDLNFTDYHQRVDEAIQFLAQLENSSKKEIIEELFSTKWDVLRIRIKGDKIGLGCISYFDKGIIEEALRKVLLTSARSISDPKPYFKRLYSASVEQWMKKCRARTPEPGSYIISIQFPLEEEIEETPFSRKVSEYLMKSLGQLVELSQKSSSVLELQNLNLNANLCLALAEMKPDDASIYFDFEMKWSPKISVNKNIPEKIEIKDRYFSTFMNIGQKLKPKSEANKDVFIGRVLTLRGEAGEDGKMEGEVTLTIFIDEEQTIKAKVFFSSKYYLAACDALKQNKYIRISGTLLKKLFKN